MTGLTLHKIYYKNTIKKFENKTFLYDKLTLNYWINKIKYLH